VEREEQSAHGRSRIRRADRARDSRNAKADTTKEAIEATQVTAVSVDSAWLKHCAPPKCTGRQVNIVAGRATLLDGKSKLYAYVGKQVPDAATRLDHFLVKQGVRHDERGDRHRRWGWGIHQSVDGSQFVRGRILNWFHIAMKFAEQSIVSSRRIEGPDWDWIGSELKGANWLVWHGKGRKAVPRLQAISEELEKWPDQQQSALWWNVRKACAPTYDRTPDFSSTVARVIERACQ
jgi:hypothetical protein